MCSEKMSRDMHEKSEVTRDIIMRVRSTYNSYYFDRGLRALDTIGGMCICVFTVIRS